MRNVKAFLGGDYIKDVSTVVNYMLISQDREEGIDIEDADWIDRQRSASNCADF